MTEDRKKCRDCKASLPLSEFYKNRDTADGLLSRCKLCWKDYAKRHKYGDGPVGRRRWRDKVDDRIGEWLIARRTLTMGDLIERQEIIARLGITDMTLKWWQCERGPYGLEFPTGIYRPEGKKALWLRSEFEEFERKYKAAKAVKRKRPGEKS